MELSAATISSGTGNIVLEEVNWSVQRNDFWVIGGLHDSGKSQLLATAAGLQRPITGTHKLFGRDTAEFDPEAMLPERLRIGMVFENGRLLNSLTVAENVALPLQYHRDLTLADAGETVKEILDLMEIAHLVNYLPSHIGRNWQLRAALARALVLKPHILFCDNPGAGLDPRHARWWVDMLTSLHQGHPWVKHPLTLVIATDNLRPWMEPGRNFALLKKKRWLTVGGQAELNACDDPLVLELLAMGTR